MPSLGIGLGINEKRSAYGLIPDHVDVLTYQTAYNSVAASPLTTQQLNSLNVAFSTPWSGGIKWDDYKQKIYSLWFAPATEGDVAAITKSFKGSNPTNVGFTGADCKPYAVQGATNKYLNLNFNPFVNLPNANSVGFGIFNSSRTYSDSDIEFGCYRADSNFGFSVNSAAYGFSGWLLSNVSNATVLAPLPEVGTKCAIRSSANVLKIYNGTTLIATETRNTASLPDNTSLGFSRNKSSSSGAIVPDTYFLDSLFSIYVMQEALTEPEWFSFNALLNYLYANRDGKFSSGVKIAFDGDSITGGGYLKRQSIPHLVSLRHNDEYSNYGVSGQTLVQMASNINTHLAERSFNCLVLFGGTNDLGGGASAATTYANAINLVQTVKGTYPNLPIVWVTTLPRNIQSEPALNARIVTFNNLVRADTTNFPIIAEANLIPELQNTANTTYYLDGLHPTPLGLTFIAGVIAPAVNLAIRR